MVMKREWMAKSFPWLSALEEESRIVMLNRQCRFRSAYEPAKTWPKVHG